MFLIIITLAFPFGIFFLCGTLCFLVKLCVIAVPQSCSKETRRAHKVYVCCKALIYHDIINIICAKLPLIIIKIINNETFRV